MIAETSAPKRFHPGWLAITALPFAAVWLLLFAGVATSLSVIPLVFGVTAFAAELVWSWWRRASVKEAVSGALRDAAIASALVGALLWWRLS